MWEEILASHYLRSDGPFGASPIRAIDATPTELARAASRLGLSAADAEKAFLASFAPSYDVQEVMRGFRRPASSTEAPGFFRYLVLTTYVPAVAVDEDASRNFRVGLGRALGLPGPVDNLSELPALWGRLVRWCEARRAEGKPYRRIVLPDPGAWTLVGYSIRLSFPSWRDRERLTRKVESVGASQISAPRTAIALLKHEIEVGNYSDAMRDAFADFRTRFQRGERLLIQHRFWRLLEEVHATVAGSRASKARTQRASLTLNFGLDDTDIDLDFLSEAVAGHAEVRLSGPVDMVLRALVSLTGAPQGAAHHILQSISAGLLLFVEQGWGRWRFCRPADIQARAIAVVRDDVLRSLGSRGPACRPVGGRWHISAPLPLGSVEELASKVLRSQVAVSSEDLISVSVVDEIRTGAAILGRSAVLPSLRAAPLATVWAEPAMDAQGSLRVCQPDENMRGAGLWELRSDAPVSGSWRVLASENEPDEGATAELLLRFDGDAVEHASLESPDRSPTLLEAPRDALFSSVGALVARPAVISAELMRDSRPADLLEAVYAKGRAGWSEADLIALILRVFPRPDSPSAFDVLHLMHGAGWIEPRLLVRWKGRRWFLRVPRIVVVRAGSETFAVLDGATPEVIVERFSATARAAGGEVQERTPCGAWGFRMIVARVNDPAAIASDLGFECVDAAALNGHPAPSCWPAETRSLTNRELASTWCWSAGAFRRHAEPGPRGVELRRYIRVRGDDRDVFAVIHPDRSCAVYGSRTAAIIEAHRLAGQSLFHFDGRSLVRCAQDGALPAPVVDYLRLLHLSNPGILPAPTRPSAIAYPADRLSARFASRLFGDAVSGADRRSPDGGLEIAVARHRSSAHRLAWRGRLRDGRLTHVDDA